MLAVPVAADPGLAREVAAAGTILQVGEGDNGCLDGHTRGRGRQSRTVERRG